MAKTFFLPVAAQVNIYQLLKKERSDRVPKTVLNRFGLILGPADHDAAVIIKPGSVNFPNLLFHHYLKYFFIS